jgi:hypothetical protein
MFIETGLKSDIFFIESMPLIIHYNPVLLQPALVVFNDNALLDDIACIIAPNIHRELVTGFAYAVMCQFVMSAFTQADRKGNRIKYPLSYDGLKCKYCEGK